MCKLGTDSVGVPRELSCHLNVSTVWSPIASCDSLAWSDPFRFAIAQRRIVIDNR